MFSGFSTILEFSRIFYISSDSFWIQSPPSVSHLCYTAVYRFLSDATPILRSPDLEVFKLHCKIVLKIIIIVKTSTSHQINITQFQVDISPPIRIDTLHTFPFGIAFKFVPVNDSNNEQNVMPIIVVIIPNKIIFLWNLSHWSFLIRPHENVCNIDAWIYPQSRILNRYQWQ